MKTRDLRIERIQPLLPPAILIEEQPLSEKGSLMVTRAREEVAEIIGGRSDRLLVVVGPCSVHDPAAAHDLATRPDIDLHTARELLERGCPAELAAQILL